MHAFVPKHCQNLLYKPNKPDREEQISVAMFSLKTIYVTSAGGLDFGRTSS